MRLTNNVIIIIITKRQEKVSSYISCAVLGTDSYDFRNHLANFLVSMMIIHAHYVTKALYKLSICSINY